MEIGPLIGEKRSDAAAALRKDAAEKQRQAFSTDHPDNDDEERYAQQNYIGSYTKGLPHDAKGEVISDAYTKLRHALESGRPEDFNSIPLGCTASGRGQVKLVSPQAAYAYQLEGQDSHGLTMPPAPPVDSAEIASEMAECYWQALTRDLPFSKYDTDPLTQAAAQSLSKYSAFKGPKESDRVTTRTLFRVNTRGDLTGPFISQFLVQPFFLGALRVEQRYRTTRPGIDYITDFREYLQIQNGCTPAGSDQYEETLRYIYSGRSLGEYIHFDPPLSHFFYAASILLGYVQKFGPDQVFDRGNPYINNPTQQGFVTFATGKVSADLTDICTRVALEALKAAWYQKWLVHRRLRPEEYAGWIDNIKSGRDQDYPINREILNDNDLLQRVFTHNEKQNINFRRGTTGSYLLPMSFPEGAPLHPAYPSGHAVYGGAGVTVLKAIFNEDLQIPEPMMANEDGTKLMPYSGTPLTVGGELNKLASNIGYARDFTGVHWRSDGVEGQLLGEQVAIAFLQDRVRIYNEDFSGYTLTKFNSQKIRINKNGTITNL